MNRLPTRPTLMILLTLTLAGCATPSAPAPLPAETPVGLWTGTLVNTTVRASYPYLVNLKADGTAGVTNEQNRTVYGDWTADPDGTVTLGFTINGNTLVLLGKPSAAQGFSGTWRMINRADVGTFAFQRKALD